MVVVWAANLRRAHLPEVYIGDDRLHYFDEGKGPPIVMVHGSCGGGGQWKTLAALLIKAGYRVIRPDMLGMGASSPWPLERRWTPKDDRLAMEKLLDQISASAHLVTHSAAAINLWPFIKARRADIRSWTMFEPVFCGLLKESDRPEQKEFDDLTTDFINKTETGDIEGALALFTDRWAKRVGTWTEMPEAVKAAMLKGGPRLYHELKNYPPPPFRADLEALEIPAILIRGEHATPAMVAICDLTGELIGAPPIVIKGAGHFAPFTHAEAALPNITEHLRVKP